MRWQFISFFNASVRALDIRDPRCLNSDPKNCKVAIQTNNVDVDDRGLIYIVDRASTGMHVLDLTGAARAVANFPR